ncbi:MAG: FAD-dependent oxidoreductase, partial [Micrococcales bacterium]|nr:FAD-dependent oxidoreductase [Micrococcales bacterium]
MAEHNYDLVILGGGSGGYAAALRSAQLGLSVALIEKDKLGGTCLHRGCIPTKALLHSAEVADVTREAANYGIHATFQGVDMSAVNKYRDGIIDRLFKGLTGLVASKPITVVAGEGRMVGPKTISVGADTYTGKNIVLATGSFSRTLPGLEIQGRVMTSELALQLDFVPSKVIVLGGGVIGVEFASIWKSLGADVTIIEGLPTLVPNEDPSVSKALERAFRKRGINFKTGVRFSGVQQSATGVVATLENGETFDAEIMLVAVGRGPNTA